MNQLICVILSFLLVPILIKSKVKLSYTLLIIASVLGLISGIGLRAFGNSILSIATDSTSLNVVLTVLMVVILSGLMKHYGIIDKIVDTMVLVIRNKKNILMIVPIFTGFLMIPGGAMLSAPSVNEIGKELDIPPPKRAAINLVFRHIAMFILPYSTSILIVLATIPEISYPRFIQFNLFFVAILLFTGSIILMKDVKTYKLSPVRNIREDLIKLAIYTSPIYIAVLMNVITGLPFYITLLTSIFIVYLLSDKKEFLRVILKSINWDTILTVVAVLIIKDIILNMEDLFTIFNNKLEQSNGFINTLTIFFISSTFFGYITGNSTATLAIVLPMISQLEISGDMLHLYTYFIFGSSFLGYFFSPLHLCQAFTIELMEVTTGQLYNEYKKYAPTILILFILSVFVLKLIFI